MRGLYISFITISIMLLVGIAGLSYFEDARVSRCLERLHDPSWEESTRRAVEDLAKAKENSDRQQTIVDPDNFGLAINKDQDRVIREQRLDDEAYDQYLKRLRKFHKAQDECMSRMTPKSWSNFLLDMTL